MPRNAWSRRISTRSTGLGKPISSRARLSQRTVESYLKAGVKPRWMERISEIDNAIAHQKRRFARAHRALRERVRRRPGAVRPALDGVRAARPLRRAQRADPAAQRLVPDRARPADGPAHARLRARRRQELPPRAAFGGVGAPPCSPARVGSAAPCASSRSRGSTRRSSRAVWRATSASSPSSSCATATRCTSSRAAAVAWTRTRSATACTCTACASRSSRRTTWTRSSPGSTA